MDVSPMYMEFEGCHVPAFGSWNGTDDLPFSECFDMSRQVSLYPFYGDRDLYVAGDLYGYDHLTPAVIVVPRRRRKSRHPNASESKKSDWITDVKQPPSPIYSPAVKKTYKPVDEDLYKISPKLLYSKPKKMRGWGIFSSCCIPI